MSSRLESLRWLPEYGWWAMLACVITAGLVCNWFIAAGVLVVLLIHAFRPFDFIAAYLLVTAGSTFVYQEGGTLTLQLSLLTGAILLMLICYLLSNRGQAFAVPWTSLSWATLAYLLLSVANFGRGLISAYPRKSVLLEVLPVLAFGTTLLVANGFEPKRDLRLVVLALTGIAFGSAAMGFYVFAIIRTHTSGVYFNAVPGMVALLLVNLALRSSRLATAFMWVGLSLPLFLHQFLSFRRALWVGCLAGLLSSILIFVVGRGQARWSRTGLVVGTLMGLGVAGAISLELFYGQTDILKESAGRFASIGGTELTMETRSNVLRLVESAAVAGHIQESPWIGHGLGYTFIVQNPLHGVSRPQNWMDQNYLLIWLKQGVIGLAAYLWILWTAFWLGARHARQREDPWESSWFATTAAATAFLTVFSLSDWPFGQVNPTFLLALFFGGSMAMAGEGLLRFRWSAPGPLGGRSRHEELVGAVAPGTTAGS